MIVSALQPCLTNLVMSLAKEELPFLIHTWLSLLKIERHNQ